MPETGGPISRAISSGAKATLGARIFLGLFFGAFLAVGVGMGGVIFGRPVLRMIDALDWTPTTCEILSSRVSESAGDNGPTYRVEVSYRYFVGGQTFTGNRFKFVGGATSGRRRKWETVQRLPPGARVDCFVNPEDPAESVIVRGPTGDLAFGLIPLIFTIIGGTGVGAAFARGPFARHLSPRAEPTHMTYGAARERGRFTRLVPIHSRVAKAVGLAVFALIWNGAVSVALYQIFDNWQRRVFAWPMALFITPFVLVGLIVLVLGAMQVLAYFNPVPHLTVNAKLLALGEELKLRWVIEGRIDKLRQLTITLEGREEATYRRGTDTRTDKQTFTMLPLVDELAPLSIDGGTARATIPAGSMHSFTARNNKIVWYVKLRGDVMNWPNIEDEFILHVTPAR